MADMTIEQVKKYPNEALVLQGCGGEISEWVDGINEILTQSGILLNGSKFEKAERFQIDGHTDLLFDLDTVDLNVGKLAIWRLRTHEAFGGTWLSDFKVNRLGCSEQEFAEPEANEIQMGGL